jgi:superkiller protein 3
MAWDIRVTAEEVALLMEAGLIYRYSGKFDEARDTFKGVRVLRPDSEIPEIALGTVSFAEGHFKEAIDLYQKAIQMNPRSAYAYAHLGEAEAFMKDQNSARRSLNKALELDPRGQYGSLARGLLALLDLPEFS